MRTDLFIKFDSGAFIYEDYNERNSLIHTIEK